MSAIPAPSTRRAALVVSLGAVAWAVTACSPDSAATPQATTASPAAVTVLEGRFEVEAGRSLALACRGEGSPTVVYDAGTGTRGTAVLAAAPPVLALAEITRVCSYDRAGLGGSDPAPDVPRTVDDLVDDLHALLAAADVAGPYLLVGSSGGGFDVYHYAGRHPGDVVGLVMDDVPAPQAEIPASEVPAWDSAGNPEHMDYVVFEHQLATQRLPIPSIPVTVLWATRGQSESASDQALWLEGSSHPVTTTVASGHDIMHGNPYAVADAIAEMIELVRR